MYRHILVPVDGSATSKRALQEALGLAREQGAQLEMVHVMEDILFLENEAYINYAEVRRSVRTGGEKILAHIRVSEARSIVRRPGAQLAAANEAVPSGNASPG